MRPSNNLGKKISSETYGRVQLVFVKVKAHSSSESPLECNQDQIPLTFDKSKFVMTFLTNTGVAEILHT